MEEQRGPERKGTEHVVPSISALGHLLFFPGGVRLNLPMTCLPSLAKLLPKPPVPSLIFTLTASVWAPLPWHSLSVTPSASSVPGFALDTEGTEMNQTRSPSSRAHRPAEKMAKS